MSKRKSQKKQVAARFVGPLQQGVKRKAPKPKSAKAKSKPGKQSHVQSACSIIDPFCGMAKGARLPDGLGTQSMPYQVTSLVTVTTDAAGAAKFIFVPAYGLFGVGQASLAASTWTNPATWNSFGSGSTYLNTNAATVRLVSFGVRVASIASATNCSGYIILGSELQAVISQTQTSGRINFPEKSIRPLTSGYESCWVSKPVGTGAHQFVPVASVTNTFSALTWTALSLEIVGGPATNSCVVCEVFCNVEFTINDSAASVAQLLPPNKPANPVATTVQNRVQSAMPAIFDKAKDAASKTLESMVSGAVDDVLEGAMAWLTLL